MGSARQALQPAAAAVADAGRSTDDQVAHMTGGELVIPKALIEKAPEFKKLVEGHFKANGRDMARFTVGDTANSINPKTGAPEFRDSRIGTGVQTHAPIDFTKVTDGGRSGGDNSLFPPGVDDIIKDIAIGTGTPLGGLPYAAPAIAEKAADAIVPKPPAPATVGPAPTTGAATPDAAAVAQADIQAQRDAPRGRAANVLTSNRGLDAPSTATNSMISRRVLLGA